MCRRAQGEVTSESARQSRLFMPIALRTTLRDQGTSVRWIGWRCVALNPFSICDGFADSSELCRILPR
jgi:hypothetical protein